VDPDPVADPPPAPVTEPDPGKVWLQIVGGT
jgi:hypothetical protein